ncbi:hypothetical protein [Micromonospora sp. SH-82]|uniref:hypothetical protein n=1 Tax=Micromonospora sp. SH-82 TaxID=3132938 RepID=UPI003EBF0304
MARQHWLVWLQLAMVALRVGLVHLSTRGSTQIIGAAVAVALLVPAGVQRRAVVRARRYLTDRPQPDPR